MIFLMLVPLSLENATDAEARLAAKLNLMKVRVRGDLSASASLAGQLEVDRRIRGRGGAQRCDRVRE